MSNKKQVKFYATPAVHAWLDAQPHGKTITINSLVEKAMAAEKETNSVVGMLGEIRDAILTQTASLQALGIVDPKITMTEETEDPDKAKDLRDLF